MCLRFADSSDISRSSSRRGFLVMMLDRFVDDGVP
jgi:hypothetical protein